MTKLNRAEELYRDAAQCPPEAVASDFRLIHAAISDSPATVAFLQNIFEMLCDGHGNAAAWIIGKVLGK